MREVISAFAGVFGLIVILSALLVDPEGCAVGARFRLAGTALGLVLLGSALAALVEGTRPQYMAVARTANLFLGVFGWLLLIPWFFLLILVSSCH
jgi:hypothetical protein